MDFARGRVMMVKRRLLLRARGTVNFVPWAWARCSRVKQEAQVHLGILRTDNTERGKETFSRKSRWLKSAGCFYIHSQRRRAICRRMAIAWHRLDRRDSAAARSPSATLSHTGRSLWLCNHPASSSGWSECALVHARMYSYIRRQTKAHERTNPPRRQRGRSDGPFRSAAKEPKKARTGTSALCKSAMCSRKPCWADRQAAKGPLRRLSPTPSDADKNGSSMPLRLLFLRASVVRVCTSTSRARVRLLPFALYTFLRG